MNPIEAVSRVTSENGWIHPAIRRLNEALTLFVLHQFTAAATRRGSNQRHVPRFSGAFSGFQQP
jgi:hypothetical protein